MSTSEPAARLAELGLELPQTPAPAGSYVPALVDGDMVYVSGQVSARDGELVATGRVGEEVDVETAMACAQASALNVLAQVAAAIGGLERIERVCRLTVFVASAPGFNEQHVVANGASDLIVDVLGEHARHSRSAVGVAELPLDTPVEVDGVFRAAAS